MKLWKRTAAPSGARRRSAPLAPQNPAEIYSAKTKFYASSRPSYPRQVLDFLQGKLRLGPRPIAADVGSGTGIFSRLLLENGCRVHAVEPNPRMRAVAEKNLSHYSGFHSVGATAERTTLASSSIDIVTAAQSFHWFDPKRARSEFSRILKPDAPVILLWNERCRSTSPFLRSYERFLRLRVSGYEKALAQDRSLTANLRGFFDKRGFRDIRFPNHQDLTLKGLVDRFLSSSFAPLPDRPELAPLVDTLTDIHRRHAFGGLVRMEYVTLLIYGR